MFTKYENITYEFSLLYNIPDNIPGAAAPVFSRPQVDTNVERCWSVVVQLIGLVRLTGL